MAKRVTNRNAVKKQVTVSAPAEMKLHQRILKVLRSGKRYDWPKLSAAVGEDIEPRRHKLFSEMIAEGARFLTIKEGAIRVGIQLLNPDSFDRNGNFIRKPGPRPKGPFYHEEITRIPLPL